MDESCQRHCRAQYIDAKQINKLRTYQDPLECQNDLQCSASAVAHEALLLPLLQQRRQRQPFWSFLQALRPCLLLHRAWRVSSSCTLCPFLGLSSSFPRLVLSLVPVHSHGPPKVRKHTLLRKVLTKMAKSV